MCFEVLLDPTESGKGLRKQLEQKEKDRMNQPELMKVRVELGDQVFDLDLSSETRIDTDLEGLNQALANIAGQIAKWGMIEQMARRLVDRLESSLEVMEAAKYKYYTERLTERGQKATVDAIRSQIVLDEERQALAEQLADARHNQGVVVVGRQAMVHKKDSLMELARNLRAEMDNQLAVARKRMADQFGGKG